MIAASLRVASSTSGVSRAAVFIDKDGTLLDNVPHNVDPMLLRFQPGALESLAALVAAGLALVVVTNQSGLSLGYFTRWQFSQLQAALERQLDEAGGIALTDFVVCPHTPTPDGRPACLCRLPAPGMLIRAARGHSIDLAASWMVGDKLDDIEAGRRAGCRTLLLNTGGETEWRRSPLRTPHARCTRWDAVTPLILADRSGLRPAGGHAQVYTG
jgi:D-glycero-D-manno-heptose 1,7-bisphosphate phosphatase